MVSKLNLTAGARVLDPCMGSGHFLDGIFGRLIELYAAEGLAASDVYRPIVEQQVYGGDIETFARSLAAIRLFLLSEEPVEARPNLFVHDMLLHSPERPQEEPFARDVERVAGADPELDELAPVDEVRFDAVVGNPPYGARKPEYKQRIYAQLYGLRERDLDRGSVGTGDGDTYGMFFNSALATYVMKRLVNSIATADVGYLEKLPYRRPSAELEASVVERVERIVAALQTDPTADIQQLRDEIDDLIFDLFEIRGARDEVRRFHRTVGRAEAQAAIE